MSNFAETNLGFRDLGCHSVLISNRFLNEFENKKRLESMQYNIRDVIEYIVCLIGDFAAKHNLSEKQAFRYLDFHKGISFIEKNYGIIHTLDFAEAVDSVTLYCRKSGGQL